SPLPAPLPSGETHAKRHGEVLCLYLRERRTRSGSEGTVRYYEERIKEPARSDSRMGEESRLIDRSSLIRARLAPNPEQREDVAISDHGQFQELVHSSGARDPIT